MQSHFIEVLGDGSPIAVLHTPGLDRAVFRPWLDTLSKSNRLVYFDHRGSGRSAHGSSVDELTRARWIQDADAIRESLGYSQWYLFGHSFGGFLALEYALRFPDRVAGLVLCATAANVNYTMPIVEFVTREGTPEQKAAMGVLLQGPKSDPELATHWKTAVRAYLATPTDDLVDDIIEGVRFNAASYTYANVGLGTYDVTARLGEIRTPTLIVTGSKDMVCPLDPALRCWQPEF